MIVSKYQHWLLVRDGLWNWDRAEEKHMLFPLTSLTSKDWVYTALYKPHTTAYSATGHCRCISVAQINHVIDWFDSHTLSVSTPLFVSNQEGFTKRTLSDLTDDLIVVHNTWKTCDTKHSQVSTTWRNFSSALTENMNVPHRCDSQHLIQFTVT